MRRLLASVSTLAAWTLLAFAIPTGAASDADPSLIAQGEYLARAGDCAGCHTAPSGRPYAGGLALATPVGAVYSTNITPHPTAGIGAWSFDDFARLMRTGVMPSGDTVYPAMPYPSYSRLGDDDLRALYAYFELGVPADATANRKPDIPWPLSLRFPLTLWRWVFAPAPAPQTVPAGDVAVAARGAYLVQGLGHCGACHTARGIALQEKALTEQGNDVYLGGGAPVDGWPVPSLRNEHGGGLAPWSSADIVEFLQTGRNPRSAVFGGMSDVVTHSTQHLTATDLEAIALYLKSLPPHDPARAPFVPDPRVGRALYQGIVEDRGARVYLDRCAGCHRSDGSGASRAFPALAGNPALQSADPSAAIRIVLSGAAVPATRKAPSALTMAPYAALLDDAQIADVVSFIQTSWGNRGAAAMPAQVAAMRSSAVPVAAATEASFGAGRQVAASTRRP